MSFNANSLLVKVTGSDEVIEVPVVVTEPPAEITPIPSASGKLPVIYLPSVDSTFKTPSVNVTVPSPKIVFKLSITVCNVSAVENAISVWKELSELYTFMEGFCSVIPNSAKVDVAVAVTVVIQFSAADSCEYNSVISSVYSIPQASARVPPVIANVSFSGVMVLLRPKTPSFRVIVIPN